MSTLRTTSVACVTGAALLLAGASLAARATDQTRPAAAAATPAPARGALADAAITRRMEEMKAVEEELKATLALADGAAEEDLARLTAVYQAMKPKDAAKLFETMSPEFAAGFLGRMPPESAAAILSGMSSEAAYGVSVIVAGRNAEVPKN